MTDDKPDLTKTEVRQGNSRKMNSRALIFGLAALIILFALFIWFSAATYNETPTTTGGGTTIEETPAAEETIEGDLDALPTPAPVEEPAAEEPVEDAAPVETEAAPAAEGAPAADAPAEEPAAAQ